MYKDIEASSRKEAESHYADPADSGWTIISKGLILDYVATEDTKTENHDIFIEKEIKESSQ